MENYTEEIEISHQVSPQVIYEQDKAAIDMQISTAKAFPRNIKRATENALAIATMDVATAQACTYSVPRGDKAITGPSIHLAKILYQVWGNLRIDAKVVAIDATHVTSEAVCFDLENNLALKVQVKRSIIGRNGKRFSDDMCTVTGNASNSIALRNAVLAVIPKPVVDRVYNAAKSTIMGDVSDKTKLIGRRKQVFDGLKDTYGLTEKEILTAIGRAAIDHVTGDDLVILIGIGTAIKDGDTTLEQAFRPSSAAPVKDAKDAIMISVDMLKKLVEEKAALLSKAEFDAAQRIINANEVASFKKLHKLLTEKI
jgi:precorrin-6B methylase 2